MPVRQLRVAPAEARAEDGTAVQRPEVRVLTGVLRGRRKRTAEGSTYFSFLGVPYGAPPVGELRFKAPRPAVAWEGVRDAAKPGRICHQPMLIPPFGPKSWSKRDVASYIKTIPALLHSTRALLSRSEDCLYANVFTPEADFHPRLPVLVLIHGGGFRYGDGYALYGPDYLMDAGGLVFVTFNYRLGPFGFLATGTKEAPGNAGLKDQALLLRWVRDNIAAFGGDPDHVTIYGESAGGVSVHMHSLSTLSKGLFHRVIASSNLAKSDWGHEEDPLVHARSLAEACGVGEEDMRDPDRMVQRLREMPARRLARKYHNMWPVFTPSLSLGMMFVAVVEPPLEGAFLDEDPIKIVAEGRQHHVPIMVGFNSREGLIALLGLGDGVFGDKNKSQRRAFMANCMRQPAEAFVPRDLWHAVGEDRLAREALGRLVLHHYFGPKGVGPDRFDDFIDLLGDKCFVLPLLRVGALLTATNAAPVYQYYFTHKGDMGTFSDMLKLHGFEGVSHGDDLGYFLRPLVASTGYREQTFRDLKCRERMTSLIANFVRTGNPTPPEWAKEYGVTWEPRSKTGPLRYMEISDEVVMRSGIPIGRLRFWDSIYKKYLGISLF